MFYIIYQYFKYKGWKYRDRMDNEQFENLYKYFLTCTIEKNDSDLIIKTYKVQFVIKITEPFELGITYPRHFKKFDWIHIERVLELIRRAKKV